MAKEPRKATQLEQRIIHRLLEAQTMPAPVAGHVIYREGWDDQRVLEALISEAPGAADLSFTAIRDRRNEAYGKLYEPPKPVELPEAIAMEFARIREELARTDARHAEEMAALRTELDAARRLVDSLDRRFIAHKIPAENA